MPKELTPAERQVLKGRAHRLHPVVLIGAGGLTPAVVAEVDRALKAHELVKLRVMGEDRDVRARVLGEVCAATDATPVQHIGKVLVIYREEPKPAPVEAHPAPRPAPRRRPAQRTAPRRRPEQRAAPRSRIPKPRRGKLRPR